MPRMSAVVDRLVGGRARLEALQSYQILDTPAEALFDDLVQAARALCDVPIALVSLVDANRQWFKARVGINFECTPVEQAVCAYAMHNDGLFVIPDLTNDPRTADNPLVTPEDGIRFYAGAPLVDDDGHALGSLCVIDTVPRPAGLNAGQREGLLALGRVVISLITMRRNAKSRDEVLAVQLERGAALRELRARMESAEEAGRIGTFDYDFNSNMIRVSPQMCRVFGIGARERCTASELEDLIIPEDFEALRESRLHLKPGRNDAHYRIVRPDNGAVRWIQRRGSYEFNDDGRPKSMVGTVEDVTDRVDSDDQQAIINQEISHRLKNGLAMAQAIATQTLRKKVDHSVIALIQERLAALGTAHDLLMAGNWQEAQLADIVEAVTGAAGQDARVDRNGPDVKLGSRCALTTSLLLHELLTNAIKHGALSAERGRVSVSWREVTGKVPVLVLNWSESGGPPVTKPDTRGFGSRLIDLGLAGTGGATLLYEPEGFSAEFQVDLKTAQRP
jgi:PAS domain S-box-containing protein